MKLYDPVVDPVTGNIKIETELTPEEIRALLGTALVFCISHGMAPNSLTHHFLPGGELHYIASAEDPSTGEQVKTPVEETPQVVNPAIEPAGQPSGPKVRTIEQLTKEEQEQFLKQVDPTRIPQT